MQYRFPEKGIDSRAEIRIIPAFCNYRNLEKRRKSPMAEKISKTARASLGDKGHHYEHPCPQCGSGMVATKVMRYRDMPGGMYWICQKDDHRIKI